MEKAYKEYDEQNSNKIKNLTVIEDEIIQLQCDVKIHKFYTTKKKNSYIS